MKPSLYFKDCFRYFFKRFCNKDTLFRWFLKQAGEESYAFEFPSALKGQPKTLIILSCEVSHTSNFMRSLPDAFFKNTLILAHESLQAIVSAKRARALYYSDLECRYGETVFLELEQKIKEFSPTVCIYLGEAFLPRLYLAKVSGATCRIGFLSENCYPFLNISLHNENSSEKDLLLKYCGVNFG